MNNEEITNFLQKLQPYVDTGSAQQIKYFTDALSETATQLKIANLIRLQFEIIESKKALIDSKPTLNVENTIQNLAYVTAFLEILFTSTKEISKFILSPTLACAKNLIPSEYYSNLLYSIIEILNKYGSCIPEVKDTMDIFQNIIPDLKKLKSKIEYSSNIDDIRQSFNYICTMFEATWVVIQIMSTNKIFSEAGSVSNNYINSNLFTYNNEIIFDQKSEQIIQNDTNDIILRAAKERLDYLENENTELAEELFLQKSIFSPFSSFAEFKEEFTKKETEIKELNQRIIDFQNQITQINNENKLLKAKKIKLTALAESKQTMLVKYTNELEQLRENSKTIEELQSKNNQLEAKIEETEQKFHQSLEKIKMYEKTEQQLIDQIDLISNLEETIENLEKDNKKLSISISEYKNKCSFQNEQLRRKEFELEGIKNSLTLLQNKPKQETVNKGVQCKQETFKKAPLKLNVVSEEVLTIQNTKKIFLKLSEGIFLETIDGEKYTDITKKLMSDLNRIRNERNQYRTILASLEKERELRDFENQKLVLKIRERENKYKNIKNTLKAELLRLAHENKRIQINYNKLLREKEDKLSLNSQSESMIHLEDEKIDIETVCRLISNALGMKYKSVRSSESNILRLITIIKTMHEKLINLRNPTPSTRLNFQRDFDRIEEQINASDISSQSKD